MRADDVLPRAPRIYASRRADRLYKHGNRLTAPSLG